LLVQAHRSVQAGAQYPLHIVPTSHLVRFEGIEAHDLAVRPPHAERHEPDILMLGNGVVWKQRLRPTEPVCASVVELAHGLTLPFSLSLPVARRPDRSPRGKLFTHAARVNARGAVINIRRDDIRYRTTARYRLSDNGRYRLSDNGPLSVIG